MYNLKKWINYIENYNDSNIVLGLDRVKKVAEKLDIIDQNSKIFTVSGTNGKGTTCRVLEKLLMAEGYSVGVYNSPHLIQYKERIRIQGKELSDTLHINTFLQIEKYRGNISLTFFEYSTLSALILFKQYNLDIVILEVGLGGRLDATNIIDSDVAIITSIALDHTKFLGDSLEKIGLEKAGIFRSRKIAIVGGNAYKIKTIKEFAFKIGANLFQYKSEWFISKKKNYWNFEDIHGSLKRLPYPKIPLQNAATALAALRFSGLFIREKIIYNLLGNINLPGRFEIFSKNPFIIFDVAHNPHAAKYLSKLLKKLPRKHLSKIYAIVGMLRDKDIFNTLKYLIPNVESWYCISLNVPRAATAHELKKYLPEKKTKCFDNIISALNFSKKIANKDDIILVFGSFHTVGQAMLHLNQNEK